jgi:hypothetical protein
MFMIYKAYIYIYVLGITYFTYMQNILCVIYLHLI